ncbi:hypothetical protein HYC85_007323 [Camellia sinensis]|uniref:Cytochrome P450 n=1 Tax=Camellia sinensis TaxID=4442 RepID=A0A7J7HPV7_CAMSI|nr:hypothetical protein HYC85_007323 [Camellia sinensis]
MEFLGYLVCSVVFLILIRGRALFSRRRTLPPGPTGLPLFGNLFEVGPKPHESLAKLAKTYGPLMTIVIHGLALFLRRRTLPPGPIGLPLFGNLFEVGPKPHESLAKLAETYGPLMSIRLGSKTSVAASSPDVAREILQKHDEAFSGRTVPDAVTALENHNMAVLWISAGDQWRERRDRAVAIGELAFITALNQMSNTCFSVNVAGFESGEVQEFLNAVKTLMVVDGKFNIADVFPWLKPFDPQGLRRRAKVAYDWLDAVSDGFVTRRLKHRESNLPSYGD